MRKLNSLPIEGEVLERNRSLCFSDSLHKVLARLEVRNIMSRNFNSRIFADITSGLLGPVLQRPGTPTANENILFLNKRFFQGIHDTLNRSQHCLLVYAGLL